MDYAGKFGRIQVEAVRGAALLELPAAGQVATDYLPTCFAEAEYLVNFANLKAHTGARA